MPYEKYKLKDVRIESPFKLYKNKVRELSNNNVL